MTYSKEKKDSWRKIELFNVDDKDGQLAGFLFDLGCLGITEQNNGLILYFDAGTSDMLVDEIEQFLFSTGNKDFRLLDQSIEDENWHLNWQTYFTPQKISDKITIYPEWIEAEESVPIPIKMRPGMAFGTGTHETTQLATQLLEENLQEGMKILDAGCGAGILTITALKLGAGKVRSVEIDPEAAENFKENLGINRCKGEMQIADVTKLDTYDFDLIVSNIQFNPNVALLKTLNKVGYSGPVILTGILVEERNEFAKILKQYETTIEKELTKNEWIAFLVRKN